MVVNVFSMRVVPGRSLPPHAHFSWWSRVCACVAACMPLHVYGYYLYWWALQLVLCCATVCVFVLFAGAVMKVPLRKTEKKNERERQSGWVRVKEVMSAANPSRAAAFRRWNCCILQAACNEMGLRRRIDGVVCTRWRYGMCKHDRKAKLINSQTHTHFMNAWTRRCSLKMGVCTVSCDTFLHLHLHMVPRTLSRILVTRSRK